MKSVACLAGLFLVAPGCCIANATPLGPTLSGSYSIEMTSLCQARQSVVHGSTGGIDSDATLEVNSVYPGTINQTVGLISFMPARKLALSGSVSATLTSTTGSLLITTIDSVDPGGATTIATATLTGSYSMTGSTLTISFLGSPTQPFTAYFSQIAGNGLANHAVIIDLDPGSPGCSNSATLQRQ